MQANLFHADEKPESPVRHLLDDAELLEYPSFIESGKAAQILDTLIADTPWQQEHIRIAGKLRAIPRLQCWMGDRSSEYGYSGVRLSPCPWHETVREIHDGIANELGIRFNSVLINYYRNGQDSVAWHADDEAELGANPVIASVSLGAERVFELKRNRQSSAGKYKMTLSHGSLLLMSGAMQQHWLHQLPKDKSIEAPRVNLTFRNILS